MLDAVPTLTDYDREAGNDRRGRLVAALAHVDVSQAELARRLNLAGEKTAVTTINRWVRGKAVMGEGTLRYVLTVLGLPADWTPPAPPSTSTPPSA